jgi:acyl-coenzyme A synthetase/AMP-(fatty) acid ligase
MHFWTVLPWTHPCPRSQGNEAKVTNRSVYRNSKATTADIGWVTGHTYIAYGPLSNGVTQVVYEGTPAVV